MSRARTYGEFFHQPFEPGRFWWTLDGVSMLLQWGTKRGEHIRLFTNHAADNWSAPGDQSGWDNNLERPTLSPSIAVWNDDETAYAFHGFLENGELREV